jgi:hypothetical protein
LSIFSPAAEELTNSNGYDIINGIVKTKAKESISHEKDRTPKADEL